MMLATEELRVALATTHLPLRAVADAITPALLQEVIGILHHDLRTKFGIADPHILVCGLNPHAGEGGHMGTEEIDTLIPVLDELRAQGMKLNGPLPADTLFSAQISRPRGCRAGNVPRSGSPRAKIPGIWSRCEYHAGPALYSHIRRSRHRT